MLDRRYRVMSRIGAGGMGIVYQVEHVQLGKLAAMKVLHAEAARNKDSVRRFQLEAQAVSRLNHPNIVQTFDFGQWEGALYLVMELIRGDDLATTLRREGPLPFSRAIPVFVQVCSALAEAHESGVIHRDLKPENIVVVRRRDGVDVAKVLDFGLAKLHERSEGADITAGGQVMGTPYYMSPEQVRSEVLDQRTDLYSLGATLYRVLTGTPPFDAPTPMSVLTKHLTDELELPRLRAPELNLPVQADEIIGRAMAKERERRFESAAEMQRALERALVAQPVIEGPGVSASRRPTTPERPIHLEPSLRASGERGTPAGAPAARETETESESESQSESQSESEGGGIAAEERSGERLRRSDFDAFERSLRRKKVVSAIVLPLAVLLLAAGGAWMMLRQSERASVVEREPNNSAGYATTIPPGQAVAGRVGSRLGRGQPDLDYFRIPAGKGERVVSAHLEGLVGANLVLELYDAQGRALAKCDGAGIGEGEWLQPTKIGAAEAYLLVRPIWIQGEDPVESLPGEYRLTAEWGPPEAGWETEPNDEAAAATPVEVGKAMRGVLPTPEDKDWYRVVPASAGRLVIRVTPPPELDVIVEAEREEAADRKTKGDRADRTNRGGVEVLEVRAEANLPVVIGVARRTRAGTPARAQARAAVVEQPYVISVELRTGTE